MAELSGAPAPAGGARAVPPGVVMRPDHEVNVRGDDKTVALAAPAPGASGPVYEPTVGGMPTAAAPGYDPTQKKEEGDAAFAKTDVFRKSDTGSGTGGA